MDTTGAASGSPWGLEPLLDVNEPAAYLHARMWCHRPSLTFSALTTVRPLPFEETPNASCPIVQM
jgi:hypothetical protein